MFATYDEANELRVLCPICGLHKRAIVAHHKDTGTRYSIEKCSLPDCELHCKGHEMDLVLDSCSDDNQIIVSYFQ